MLGDDAAVTLIVGPGRVVGSRDKMQCLFNALLSPNAGVVPSALKDINIDISPWHDNNEELDSPIEAIRLCGEVLGLVAGGVERDAFLWHQNESRGPRERVWVVREVESYSS